MTTPSPDAPLPATLPQITVFGDFATRVTFLTQSESALVLGLGALEGEEAREVLVPYLEIRLDGHQAAEDPAEAQPLMSVVLPLEIAASLIAGLAADMQSACRQLAAIGGGNLSPEPVRLAQAGNLLGRALQDLQTAKYALQDLAGPPAG